MSDAGREQAGNTITVIDLPSGEALRRVDLGRYVRPRGLAVAPDQAVWVATEALLRLPPGAERVGNVYPTRSGVAFDVALLPNGMRAFASNPSAGTVSVIDRTGRVQHLEPGARPEALEVTPDGRELWVADRRGDSLVVYDAVRLERLATLDTGREPIDLQITDDGQLVIVSCAGSRELQIFDRNGLQQLARIGLSHPPGFLQVTPDGRRAFVASDSADRVEVVDLLEGDVIASFEPGSEPVGMAWASW